MSLRAELRRATADDHARLDETFGMFDLADATDYRRFLNAHARALAPVEQAIHAAGPPEAWHPRGPLVAADLAAMGAPLPAPLPLAPQGPREPARLWGMRYVLEGSRLGGAMLARQVGAGLPAAYLSAQHGKGEWRAFLDRLEQAGENGGPAWRADAVAGARDTFALFARSAAMEEATAGASRNDDGAAHG